MIYDLLLKISNSIGLIGVILLLLAFYLLNTQRISAQDMSYALLNLFGAVLILFSLMFHWNLASAVIEFAWIAISMLGIYRIIYPRDRNNAV